MVCLCSCFVFRVHVHNGRLKERLLHPWSCRKFIFIIFCKDNLEEAFVPVPHCSRQLVWKRPPHGSCYRVRACSCRILEDRIFVSFRVVCVCFCEILPTKMIRLCSVQWLSHFKACVSNMRRTNTEIIIYSGRETGTNVWCKTFGFPDIKISLKY